MLFPELWHMSVYSRLHIGPDEIFWIDGFKITHLAPR